MSNTQGEQPTSRTARIIGGTIAGVLLAALIGGTTTIVATANAAAAEKAAAIRTAYTSSQLSDMRTAQAADAQTSSDAVADAHTAIVKAQQERLAAEAAAAKAAAAAEAARIAAEQAAQRAAQEAAQQAAQDEPAPSDDGPTKCPAGTHAMAVDANGNESNCDPLNDQGQQCVAYDANNQCTAWLEG
jgi:membrane protein involved in colicin uptake